MAPSCSGLSRTLQHATAVAVPLVLSLAPVVGAVLASAPSTAAHGPSVVRIAASGFAAVLLLYALSVPRLGTVRASNVAAVPCFLVAVYPAFYTVVLSLVAVPRAAVSLPYLCLCVAAGVWAATIGPMRARGLHHMLAIVAAVFAVWASTVLGPVYWFPPDYPPRVAQALTSLTALPSVPRDATYRPDVYHLVLDSMGRPDALAEAYSIDVNPILRGFRELGFDMPVDRGFANYVQTHLSLPSMLNLAYLDPLLDLQRGRTNRDPLRDLVARARVPRMFQALGYRVEFIGTGYVANGKFASPDVCDCPQAWFSAAEIGTLSLTPLDSIVSLGFGHRSHYQRSMYVFEAFERASSDPRPRYVFAHTMLPHAPFVVDREGRFTNPMTELSVADGTFFRGTADEYLRGYREQASFSLRRALSASRRILRQSREDGRDAIVIISGDHGPRLGYDARQAVAESGMWTLPTLLAIRWPDKVKPEAPRSLVNLYRGIFREVFGLPLPPLPDKGFVSPFTLPYDVVRVEGLSEQAPAPLD